MAFSYDFQAMISIDPKKPVVAITAARISPPKTTFSIPEILFLRGILCFPRYCGTACAAKRSMFFAASTHAKARPDQVVAPAASKVAPPLWHKKALD
jgi:hypothetical protein